MLSHNWKHKNRHMIHVSSVCRCKIIRKNVHFYIRWRPSWISSFWQFKKMQYLSFLIFMIFWVRMKWKINFNRQNARKCYMWHMTLHYYEEVAFWYSQQGAQKYHQTAYQAFQDWTNSLEKLLYPMWEVITPPLRRLDGDLASMNPVSRFQTYIFTKVAKSAKCQCGRHSSTSLINNANSTLCKSSQHCVGSKFAIVVLAIPEHQSLWHID